jgi:hypothetical protein
LLKDAISVLLNVPVFRAIASNSTLCSGVSGFPESIACPNSLAAGSPGIVAKPLATAMSPADTGTKFFALAPFPVKAAAPPKAPPANSAGRAFFNLPSFLSESFDLRDLLASSSFFLSLSSIFDFLSLSSLPSESLRALSTAFLSAAVCVFLSFLSFESFEAVPLSFESLPFESLPPFFLELGSVALVRTTPPLSFGFLPSLPSFLPSFLDPLSAVLLESFELPDLPCAVLSFEFLFLSDELSPGFFDESLAVLLESFDELDLVSAVLLVESFLPLSDELLAVVFDEPSEGFLDESLVVLSESFDDFFDAS